METLKFNYIDFLKHQLELRLAKNQSYSLRAFARDLGLSASRLSEVLKKKKGLSINAAFLLTEKLGLTSKEKELFFLSVEALHSRSKKIMYKLLKV